MSSTTAFRARKLAILLPLLLMAFAFMMPTSAFAQESPDKTVRVGWYDSSFNNMDDSGRRSGYAYEYQLKVASYTGWTFEYVNGS